MVYTKAAYNIGRQLGTWAIKNPSKVLQMGTAVANYLRPSKPSTVAGTRTVVRTVAGPTRYIRSPVYKRKFKKFVRRKNKARKINKLVGRPSPRRTIYSRKAKTMRRYNSGKLNLQNRLQNGGALPNMTYARLFWRGSDNTNMSTRKVGGTSGVEFNHVNARSFTLNDISNKPIHSISSGTNHLVTYAPLWSTLYSEYQVRGASLKIKINPSFYPSQVQSNLNDATSNSDSRVPIGAQPGYWYVRAYYTRGTDPTFISNADTVGKPILQGVATTLGDNKLELWDNLRSFLSDPTVTYKKDLTNLRTKLHVHTNGNLHDSSGVNNAVNVFPNQSFSYEIETATKPVHLKVNFSMKKHFKIKDPSVDHPWNSWDTSLGPDYRFNVRFGYIGFGPTGNVAYHCPIDKNITRFCEYEIQYFVAFRDPRITPHDTTNPAPLNRMAELLEDDILDYVEDTPFEDDGPEIELPDLF